MKNGLIVLAAALAFCAGIFVMSMACGTKPKQTQYYTPKVHHTPKVCTCPQTIKLLYETCGRTLSDEQGQIPEADALTGCNICKANPDQYPVYCCVRTCCDANDTCNANADQEGMNACVDACILQYMPAPSPTPTPTP